MRKWKELKQWEYWPSWTFYLPLLPYLLKKVIVQGAPYTHFLHVNPSIPYSGHGNESKYETLKLLPNKLVPKSTLLSLDQPLKVWKKHIDKYPVIIKPDIGYRGLGVFKIKDENELEKCYQKHFEPIRKSQPDFLVILQEYIQTNEELSIFTVKDPKTGQFFISSLTQKEFLQLEGDGISTILHLLKKHPRGKFYVTQYQKKELALDRVLKKGELWRPNEIGNHSRGTRFININNQISEALSQNFNNLALSIKDFNYGRFDIKAEQLKDLEQGQNFKILELNGVMAEPVHIYDSDHSSYFQAIKTLKKHWSYIDALGAQQAPDQDPISLKTYLKVLNQMRKHKKLLKSIS